MIAASQRGFTMIELMIVLAVTGVLMAIAMPDFARATRSIQLSHQAKEMSGAIKLARAEAIRRGQTVVMCRSNAAQTACNRGSPTGAWELGWLVFVDLNEDEQYDLATEQDGLILVKQRLAAGVTARTGNNAYSGLFIGFNPAGETIGFVNSNNTITFNHEADQHDTNNHYLIINRTGRVRVLTNDECLQAGSGCLENR
jgi:type IV fimbrial biogenesis protein FimT